MLKDSRGHTQLKLSVKLVALEESLTRKKEPEKHDMEHCAVPSFVVVQPCMGLNLEAMQSSCRRKYGGWGLRLPCLLELLRGSS